MLDLSASIIKLWLILPDISVEYFSRQKVKASAWDNVVQYQVDLNVNKLALVIK